MNPIGCHIHSRALYSYGATTSPNWILQNLYQSPASFSIQIQVHRVDRIVGICEFPSTQLSKNHYHPTMRPFHCGIVRSLCIVRSRTIEGNARMISSWPSILFLLAYHLYVDIFPTHFKYLFYFSIFSAVPEIVYIVIRKNHVRVTHACASKIAWNLLWIVLCISFGLTYLQLELNAI